MRQQIGPEGRRHPELELTDHAGCRGQAQIDDLLDLTQHAPGPFGNLAAEGGQHRAVPVPLHQPDTQLSFQRRELGTERRLGDVNPLRGASEMPLVGDRDQVSELLEGRIGRLPCTCFDLQNLSKMALIFYLKN